MRVKEKDWEGEDEKEEEEEKEKEKKKRKRKRKRKRRGKANESMTARLWSRFYVRVGFLRCNDELWLQCDELLLHNGHFFGSSGQLLQTDFVAPLLRDRRVSLRF